MKKVLITGAGGPAGVNVAMSLRDARSLRDVPEEIKIYGTDISAYHAEFARPFVDDIFLVPRYNKPNYIDELNKIIDKLGIDFVHPQPDVEVSALSENREKLHAKLFLPSKETVRICQDKNLSAKIWDQNGFPTVKSIILHDNSLEEDINSAFKELGPNLWIRATKGAGGTGSTPCDKADIGVNWIKYWRARGFQWEFIAQENLTGKNVAFQSIWKDGKLITSQARERLEYIYPYLAPSGVTGTPVVAQTVNDDVVNKMATKAVLAIDKKATGLL
jgi:biotin carboxylase